MNAFRAKIRIATACGAAMGPVREMPPDPPDESDDDVERFIRLNKNIRFNAAESEEEIAGKILIALLAILVLMII